MMMRTLIAGVLLAVTCAQPAAAQAWQYEQLQMQLQQMQYDIEDSIAALRRDQQIQMQELHDRQLLFGGTPPLDGWGQLKPIGQMPPGWKSFPIEAR